jgi:hypothetical protein
MAAIDIGITDPDHPDGFILGVLLDNGPFMRSDAIDTEFVYRNMLTKAGWSLHRVWTPDWLSDPKGVTDRIVKAVERRKKDSYRWVPSPPVKKKADIKIITEASAPRTVETKRRARKQYSAANVTEKTVSVEALFSNSSKGMIERDIMKVIEAESPVADTVAAHRLAAAYGMKVTPKLLNHLIAMIANMNVHFTVTPWKTKILWKDAKDVSSYDSYRVPSDGGERKISEIAAEEIVNAIIGIASDDPAITAEALIVAAANIFDSRGVTDEARYIISTCIDIAKEKKLIRL